MKGDGIRFVLPRVIFTNQTQKQTMTLAAIHEAHVAQTFPEDREAMADYLSRGVAVCIGPQKECGPDVGPIAIWVIEAPEFWIDCCATTKDAVEKAKALGLQVVRVLDATNH